MKKELPKKLKAEFKYTGIENLTLVKSLLDCIKKSGDDGASFNDLLVAAYQGTGKIYKRSSLHTRINRLCKEYPIERASRGRYRMQRS